MYRRSLLGSLFFAILLLSMTFLGHEAKAKIVQKLRLKSGSIVIGKIIMMDNNIVKLQTIDGLLIIKRATIRSISFVNIPTIGRSRRHYHKSSNKHSNKPKPIEKKQEDLPPLWEKEKQPSQKLPTKSPKVIPHKKQPAPIIKHKNNTKKTIHKKKNTSVFPKIDDRFDDNKDFVRRTKRKKRRFKYWRRNRYKTVNPKKGFLVSGAIMFPVGYVLSLITSTIFINMGEPALGYISLIPVLGSTITFFGALGSSSLSSVSILLGIVAAAQILGAIFLYVGITAKPKRIKIALDNPNTSWAIAPWVSKDTAGIGITGNW